MSLVTLSEVKDRLNITGADYDDFLNIQIEYISDVIEDYCGRKFNASDYVQTYYSDEVMDRGRPLDKLYLFHYPVNSISSIKEDDEDLSDYRLHGESGKILRLNGSCRSTWFFGQKKIEVSYNAGYATVPRIIKEVTMAIISERYNKEVSGIALDFGSDVQRVSIPGTISIDFDYTLENNTRARKYGSIIGSHANMLDPFRSERPLIGSIRDNYVS